MKTIFRITLLIFFVILFLYFATRQTHSQEIQYPVSVSFIAGSAKVVDSNVKKSATPVSPVLSSAEEIEAKIRRVFGKDADTAIAITLCENHDHNPNTEHINDNGTVDHGIFQINSIHEARFKGKSMNDVDANIQVAYDIYKEQGFTPWTTYVSGCYKKYL